MITEFGGSGNSAQPIAVPPDGNLIAAGATNINGSTNFALARYNSNGALDATFGTRNGVLDASFSTNGKVTTDFNGLSDQAFAIAVQPDERLS